MPTVLARSAADTNRNRSASLPVMTPSHWASSKSLKRRSSSDRSEATTCFMVGFPTASFVLQTPVGPRWAGSWFLYLVESSTSDSRGDDSVVENAVRGDGSVLETAPFSAKGLVLFTGRDQARLTTTLTDSKEAKRQLLAWINALTTLSQTT